MKIWVKFGHEAARIDLEGCESVSDLQKKIYQEFKKKENLNDFVFKWNDQVLRTGDVLPNFKLATNKEDPNFQFLIIELPPKPNSSSSDPLSTQNTSPLDGPLPPFVGFEKNGLSVVFTVYVKKFPLRRVAVIFLNSNVDPLINFEFKIAVPKYLRLQINPPSATVVPANNSGSVRQTFDIYHTLHEDKPTVIKIKVDYQINGVAISEISTVYFPFCC